LKNSWKVEKSKLKNKTTASIRKNLRIQEIKTFVKIPTVDIIMLGILHPSFLYRFARRVKKGFILSKEKG